MSRTLIDLDDEALEAARQILGTTTKKGTVNSALRQVVQLAARRRVLARITGDGAAGLGGSAPELPLGQAWRR